jgi:Ca2+-binding RTX toxin-like protein
VSGLRDEDLIDAGDGNDTIWSGAANDVAYGGNGNDVIYGSLNDDRFYGEAGADTFIFEANSGFDAVMDFSFAAGDRIRLSGQSYAVQDTAEGMGLVLSGGGFVNLYGIEPGQFSTAFLI